MYRYLLEQLALKLYTRHHEWLAAGLALRWLVVADDLHVGVVVDHATLAGCKTAFLLARSKRQVLELNVK